jgi:hypothetical protein
MTTQVEKKKKKRKVVGMSRGAVRLAIEDW